MQLQRQVWHLQGRLDGAAWRSGTGVASTELAVEAEAEAHCASAETGPVVTAVANPRPSQCAMPNRPHGPLTGTLLGTEAQPGTLELKLFASWANETETGSMNPAAAAFWSAHEERLAPWAEMPEIVAELEEDWNEEDGQFPEADSPELDIDLEDGECEYVFQGVEILLPLGLFASLPDAREMREGEPTSDEAQGEHTRFGEERWGTAGFIVLPLHEFSAWAAAAATAEKVAAARQRLSWAAAAFPAGGGSSAAEGGDAAAGVLCTDLVTRVAMAHQAHCDAASAAEAVAGGLAKPVEDEPAAQNAFFPTPRPCSWEHTVGWKGSSGVVELQVPGEQQQQQPTSGKSDNQYCIVPLRILL